MFDPRDEIKDVLNAYSPTGQEESGIVFRDSKGDQHKVDVYLWEDKVDEFAEGGKLGIDNPNMILLSIVSITSNNKHLGGVHRNHVALIDAHIFLVKDDRWAVEDIRQEVSGHVYDCIHDSEKSVTGCIFVECINARDLDALQQTLGVRRIIGIRAIGEYD